MARKSRKAIPFTLPGCGVQQYFLPRERLSAPEEWPFEVESVWYRFEYHTLRRGEGGTDGPHIVTSFGGNLGGTLWYELDTPGDSYEQGDIDLHYIGTRDVGDIDRYFLQIYSNARNQVDAWTYKLWIDRFNEPEERWENKFFIEATTYTRDDRVPDRLTIGASVHVDAADPRNPVVDASVPLPFDPAVHRPFDS